MTTQQAIGIIKARVRDFSAWLPTHKDREAHPSPQDEASLEEMASYLEATLPIIGKADPGAWNPGGWKRVELEEALTTFHLPSLTWEGTPLP